MSDLPRCPRTVALLAACALLMLAGCAGGGDSNDGEDGGPATSTRRDAGPSTTTRRDAGPTRTVDGGLPYRGVDAGRTPTGTGSLCDDTCEYANDDECDDTDLDLCAYGTDCSDCGTRSASDCGCGSRDCGRDPCTGEVCGTCDGDLVCSSESNTCVARTGNCTDTCRWADDGECDDGGPGADFSACELGTDCTDCGPR